MRARFKSLLKYSYLLYLLLPVAAYFFILNYYTPGPFHISYQLSCDDKQQCQFKLDQPTIDQINSDLQTQLDKAERLDQFSKPFSGYFRFTPRITNKSTVDINISNPAQTVPQQLSVECELNSILNIFTYGSGIISPQETTLSNAPDAVKSAASILTSCIRGFQSEPSNLKLIVAPQGIVSMQNVRVDFLIEFLSDKTTKFLLAIEAVAIFLALLPLLREAVKFIARGWRYFL